VGLAASLLVAACSSGQSSGTNQEGTGASATSNGGTAGNGGTAQGNGATQGGGATPGNGGSLSNGGTPGGGGSANGGTPGGGGSANGGAPGGSGGTAGASGSGSGGASGSGTGGTSTGTTGGNPSALQYHNHANRDGVYVEGAFTPDAAGNLHLDTTFKATIAGPVYAQPLYYDAGPGGTDLVIVATEQNQVVALKATDGSVAWTNTVAPPATTANLDCGNISTLGITGTPIIDTVSKAVYFDAMVLSGGQAKHMIYGLSLAGGSKMPGFPIDVGATAKSGSLTFTSKFENERGALAILNGTLYVPYGGHYFDCDDYHGWVVGVNIANPTQVTSWATRATKAGSWAVGGIASDGMSLFVTTGNSSGATSWADGEAIIRLTPGLTFSQAPADYFAPSNWQTLDSLDLDVGGSAPLLVDAPAVTPSALAMALGKDGNAYLLDRSKLGGASGNTPLAMASVSSDQIIQAATTYTTGNVTYVSFDGVGKGCPGGGGKLTTLKITGGSSPAISVAWCGGTATGGVNGGSPIVTTTDDAQSNPIVWWIGAEIDNRLHGFGGEKGNVIFGGGGQAEQMSTVQHFQTPIVAKGRIFVASNNTVYAFTTQ
jgi:hypothetical protein